MFTGLIEEIGTIGKIDRISGGGSRITIHAGIILSDLKVDHSVAVCGVCLTAVEIQNNGFKVDAVGETLLKSTLNKLHIGQKVNLERAMRLSDRLGGHIVQGHVNGIGAVRQLAQRGENWYLEVEVPNELVNYLIKEGSIAIDGVSLTIASLKNNVFGVSVIPHTYSNTIIREYKNNQPVNIETDFLARYVENFVRAYNVNGSSNITIDKLKELGY